MRMVALNWKGHSVQELHGERDLTLAEVTTALGEAIGKPDLRYLHFPYADAQKGIVAGRAARGDGGALHGHVEGLQRGEGEADAAAQPGERHPPSIERWAAEVFAPAFEASAPREAAGGPRHAPVGQSVRSSP